MGEVLNRKDVATVLPLVIGYHLIWTAYGWWLPNDPRGSSSHAICCDLLKDLGELHVGRKRVQPASSTIRRFYESAALILKYPLLTFNASEVAEIAEAFADVVRQMKYTCYACAIMPDQEMINNFQRVSHLRLREVGLRDIEHPIWGGPGWKVFLDHPNDIRRTIRYIDENPAKIGLPLQQWDFVSAPYDGWPLHPGHDPGSPWARRLRSR